MFIYVLQITSKSRSGQLLLLVLLNPTSKNTFQKQSPEVFYKKKVFLKISQNSQQNTCVSLFFKKVAGLGPDFGTGVFLWILQNF